jgi:hypothetical protein
MVRNTIRFAAFCLITGAAPAQAPNGTILDETIPPGANFDKANFRLWYPADGGPLKGVVVLMPGSNGDGRPQATRTS